VALITGHLKVKAKAHTPHAKGPLIIEAPARPIHAVFIFIKMNLEI
jgi:hypothetical protein